MSPTRRQFLTLGGAIALAPLATGCSRFQSSSLQVEVLEGSIPVQLLKRFRSETQTEGSAKFIPLAQPQAAFRQLQQWHQEPTSQRRSLLRRLSFRPAPRPADLISLGDSWLSAAIRQDLVKPLDPQQLPLWSELPAPWQRLAQRDEQGFASDSGPVWGAPYRWGGTLIAYRKNRLEQLGLNITDWEDLWQPALKGLISLPDNAREVIGLTLKRLGQSYNHPNPLQVSGLPEALAQLQSQVKLYASDNYLQPLLLEDTWVAVGPSADLLPLLQRDRNLALVFPRSGSALWADLWVKPNPIAPAVGKGTSTRTTRTPRTPHGDSPTDGPTTDSSMRLANAWINFCWRPEIVPLITNLSHGASPLANLPGLPWLDKLQHREILLPNEAALARSDFIEPLPPASLQQYAQLWQTMRQLNVPAA